MTAAVEEKPVEGGEEPRFDLRRIAELPAFLGPAQKGLLGQIAGIGLSMGETVGKLVQALIMAIDEGGEINTGFKQSCGWDIPGFLENRGLNSHAGPARPGGGPGQGAVP